MGDNHLEFPATSYEWEADLASALLAAPAPASGPVEDALGDPAPYPPPRPLLLIAEDNEDDVVLVRAAIQQARLSHDVQVVGDGQAAIDFLRRRGPFHEAPPAAMVLLDIHLPRRSGFEVLEEIKGDPALRHLPVMMLTSSASETDVLRAFGAGASSFITKPDRFEEYCALVGRFVTYWTAVSRLPPGSELG